LKSIKDLQEVPQIDVLVNNAGHIAEKFVETEEGLESTVATHLVSF
jgi:hypothetical protein